MPKKPDVPAKPAVSANARGNPAFDKLRDAMIECMCKEQYELQYGGDSWDSEKKSKNTEIINRRKHFVRKAQISADALLRDFKIS